MTAIQGISIIRKTLYLQVSACLFLCVSSFLASAQSVNAQFLTGYTEQKVEAVESLSYVPLLTAPAKETATALKKSVQVRTPEVKSEPRRAQSYRRLTDTKVSEVKPFLSVEDTKTQEAVSSVYEVPFVAAPSVQQSGFLTRDKSVEKAPGKRMVQASQEAGGESSPVDLKADKLVHDEKTQTITASGSVMMVQDGRILRADQVSYNLKTDTVRAQGNVVLNEVNGDVHVFEAVELTDKFKDGFLTKLSSVLADGSRLWAEEGERKGGVQTIMRDAAYTPCEPCENDPDSTPVWQIRAGEVTHDKEENRIRYEDATFEVLGVPMAYMPYFSHPDGSIERKSGFLPPSMGFKSGLGAHANTRYYWDIAPDKDLTAGVQIMTEQAPMLHGQYRQRWSDASLELNGGITYSDRVTRVNDIDVVQDEEVRGHVIGAGRWDINDKWRSGLDIDWASDDQYMRQYDLSNDDVLQNELYVERFSDRDYAAARLIAFQDVRIREEQEDQPELLPEIVANFKGDPDSVPLVGGRWELETSLLGLRRGGEDQDMTRLGLEAGWHKRMVSDYGFLTTADVNARADFYSVRDRNVAQTTVGQKDKTSENRFHPSAHIQTSYPIVKSFDDMQATIEPVVALTVSPNIDVNNNVPNEDSQDVQIDAGNIFEPSRFPGVDRIEDKSRLTYGINTGLYGYEGSYANIFLGQSYRFDNDDTPFPQGSGLNEQQSDIVGQLSANYKNYYKLNYRFQLDNDAFSSQRHEVDSSLNFDRFRLSARYLFAKALEGTDIDENREQLQASAAYYLSEDWRLRSGGTQDLGEQPGLRQAYLGLDYFGQCLSWSVTGQRNLTDDASGDSDTEILFTLGLKNLGEFSESALRKRNAEE